MPRKPGDLNHTVSFKRAAIAAHQDEGPNAVSEVVPSTMTSWIRSRASLESRRHGSDIYERGIGNEVEPVVAWIQEHLRVRDSQQTMTPARVMEYVEAYHKRLIESKSYHARRRMVERALKAAWQACFAYEPISQCIGVMAIASIPDTRCSCRRGCGDKCVNRTRLVECSKTNCALRGKCSNRMWMRALLAPVSLWIDNSGNTGLGVFAGVKLGKGVLVREYVGEVIDRAALEARSQRGRNKYVMALTSDKYIDSSVRGNHTRMINHACSPNCEAQVWKVGAHLRIGIVTTRTVQAEEEITIDYGSDYAFDTCECSSCQRVEDST